MKRLLLIPIAVLVILAGDHRVRALAPGVAGREVNQTTDRIMRYALHEKLPPPETIVRCHRKWTNSEGVTSEEDCIASRGDSLIRSSAERMFMGAGWTGYNEKRGTWWSDDTVEWWEEL